MCMPARNKMTRFGLSFLVLLHFILQNQQLSLAQPRPSLTSGDVSVAVGQRADLTCSLRGYMGSDVNFTIIKVMGSPSPTQSMTSSDGLSFTLSILATTLDDSGSYTCVARFGGEEDRRTITLTVRDEFALVAPPNNVSTRPGTTAIFPCAPNRPVLIVVWLRNGFPLSMDSNRHIISSSGLSIFNVTYSDMGVYSCRVTDDGMVVQASASLSLIPEYSPLRRQGTQGQNSVVTSVQLEVRCPVEGVPGPSIIYWHWLGRTPTSQRINITGNVTSGPFVDGDFQLDFSRATSGNTGFYSCTGVDELGSSATQVFYVEVSHEGSDGFVLWTQWYMILVYCVVFVVLLAIIGLCLWFCCTVGRMTWCVRLKKVVHERERIHRPKPFVFRTPDAGVDAYALNEDLFENGEETEGSISENQIIEETEGSISESEVGETE